MLVKLSQEEAQALAAEVMLNFPEYSQSLICTSYDYNGGRYEFLDEEEDKTYVLEIPKIANAINTLLEMIAEGKLPGIAKYLLPDPTDAGQWDADATDALVQIAIFGEVIYG